eukprot:7111342-Prymnesium_polylepis.1
MRHLRRLPCCRPATHIVGNLLSAVAHCGCCSRRVPRRAGVCAADARPRTHVPRHVPGGAAAARDGVCLPARPAQGRRA